MKFFSRSPKLLLCGAGLACANGDEMRAATTVIDLSIFSISQPYTNTTSLSTINTEYAFRVYDLANTGQSESNGNAGNGGGAVGISSVTNSASSVTINSYDPGQAQGVLLQSKGGAGGNYTSSNNNHNAGSGGNGGNVTGINTGSINAIGNFGTGVALFRVESYGGNGGNAANNEGRGGNGGNAGSLGVTNSGLLGIYEEQVTGGVQFRGIEAVSIGGNAGAGSSGASGGSSGDISVVHEGGGIHLELNSDSEPQQASVYGIFAKSQGGGGADSLKKDENGGAGGNGGSISVTVDEQIEIDTTGRSLDANSVAVGAFSGGGDGGKAANGDSKNISLAGKGGNAGAISVDISDRIAAVGNGLQGIIAESRGGQGGGGTNNEKSFSNDGGSTGVVTVTLDQASAIVTTNGAKATGIRATTIAGDGGSTPTSNQNAGGTAGDGGNGGNNSDVNVNLGNASGVETSGKTSIGIFAGSYGGDGGDGGELSTNGDATGDGAGKGGVGSAGGGVGVKLDGNSKVTTAGGSSVGIFVVSSGGDGGAGGKYKGDFGGSGESGGDGGNGGNVNVVIDEGSEVQSSGNDSHAIVARSLSGNGGVGGDEML